MTPLAGWDGSLTFEADTANIINIVSGMTWARILASLGFKSAHLLAMLFVMVVLNSSAECFVPSSAGSCCKTCFVPVVFEGGLFQVVLFPV